jgi:heterodisulfide reductase subunit C2
VLLMMAIDIQKTIMPDTGSRKMISELSGQKISACFQCQKCTNGCPITFAMDISPHRLIHLLQLGQTDEVLRSDTIWVCASCETCTTRCPNGIDIVRVMDSLRQLSQRQGIKASQPSMPIFLSAFLSTIKRHGRVHETEMALIYTIKDSGWLGLLKLTNLGFTMLLKGKAKLIPSRVRALGCIKNIFKETEGRAK